MSRRPHVPTYRLHKQSGQAIVTLSDGLGNRRDVLLGKFGSAESRAEYVRVIGEWEANARRLPAPAAAPADVTVAELILSYWRWAEQHYRDAQGEPSRELENIQLALKPLRRLYGHTQAAAFGPLALRVVQEDLVNSGLSRRVVNARVNRVRRVFKWGLSYQLIPSSVYEALRTVPGLQRGRCEAREAPPVQPASDDHLNATLPFLPAPVRAMVELQRLTGCRPGEVMAMRAIDLGMTAPVWAYRPASHKNKHRGLDRVIFLGPRAQEIIKPFLTTDLEAYLFSPRAYVEDMHRRRAERRKTKRPPSQLKRQRKPNPKRAPADRYNRRSYRVAVARACDKAFPPSGGLARRPGETTREWQARLTPEQKQQLHRWRSEHRWSPLQLRHTAATALRERYGVEAAQVILGHKKIEATQIYAERNLKNAEALMADIG
jgi:integrase